MAGVPQVSKSTPNLLQVVVARYDVSKDKTGKVAVTLPKGAIIMMSTAINIPTAFNGTTPTALLGITGTTAALFASADVAPATAGTKPIVAATLNAGGLNAPLAADTDIIWTVGGGGANTAGVAIACIVFAYPQLLTDLV